MKRVIGYTAVLCLLALTIGCGASSSGTLAYVSNSTGTGFTVFTVNTNGILTTSSISPQNTPAPPKVLQFSPNGKWAYFLDAAGANIYAYTRGGNGTLATFIDSYPVIGNASSLAVSPNSMFLYVAQPNALNGELAIYLIDPATGILSQLGSSLQIGYAVTQLTISPDGGVLYGLAPAQQSVISFTLNSTSGAAIGPNNFPVGTHPPQDGMILSANGSYMYVLDTTDTGTYTSNGSLNGNGVSLTGQSPNIYAFTTSSNGILTTMPGSPFHENADFSPLTETPPISAVFPKNPVAGATTGDTRFLFIANQGTSDISAFRIITGTGGLTEILGSITTVNGTPSSTESPFDAGNSGCKSTSFVAVAKANNALYVLDTSAGLICQFNVDENTGRLRALSPASVFAQSATSNPTWITIR